MNGRLGIRGDPFHCCGRREKSPVYGTVCMGATGQMLDVYAGMLFLYYESYFISEKIRLDYNDISHGAKKVKLSMVYYVFVFKTSLYL